MRHYIIYDGDGNYYNEVNGWGSRTNATRYTQDQLGCITLPSGDSFWVIA